MIEFTSKILFVGYGAVAECTLPILLKLIKVPAKNITVMDFEDRTEKLRPWTTKGVQVRPATASPAKTWDRCWASTLHGRHAHRPGLEHRCAA